MAKKKFYSDIDLKGNELENAVLGNLSAPPENPKEGQVYFDTGKKKEKYYNGTEWIGSVTPDEMDSELEKKVDKVEGKGLSENDFTNDYKSQVDSNTSARHTHSNKTILDGTQQSFTTALKSKLDGVATGAQVNVIETVEVNGTAQPVTSKTVDITVPTKTSELQNDSDFTTNASLTSGLNTKVDKVTGKQLSTNDFTNDYKSQVGSNTSARHTHSNKSILDATTASFTTSDESKLNGIASGAQVNVIESIKVNGAAQAVTSKSVNITVPTKTSQLQNDSEFVTLDDLDNSEAGIITGLENKVDKIEGKGLSTNDFTDSYQSQVNSNTTARHTHSNKAILDATTASFTTAINNTINSKANDNAVVKLRGNQTIDDVKTFTSSINGNLNGTASKATADGNGNNIAATYATKAEISGLGVKKLSLNNPQLVPSNGVVEWTVDYSSMGGIVANPPMVSIMRKSDRKQILAEVEFSTSGNGCIIRMNSDVTIPAQSYVVTIIG